MQKTEQRIILVNPVIRTTHLDKDFYYGTEKQYTPCVVDGMAARGIEIEMEKKCPEFIRAVGVSPNSPDWDLKVREYYADFSFKIPFPDDEETEAYYRLDAGYSIDDEGILKPNNFKHYMIFNMMVQDRFVLQSDNIEDPSSVNYDFVITDLTAKEKADREKHQASKDALIAYVGLISDSTDEGFGKIKLVLANNAKLLGLTTTGFSKMDRVKCEQLLKTLSEKNPTEFIKSSNDKYIKERAIMLQAIELKVIKLDATGSYAFGEIVMGTIKEVLKQLTTDADTCQKVIEAVKLEQSKLKD